MTEVVYDFASSLQGDVTLSPYEVVDNVSAPTSDRDIVFEGDINAWLFNNGILCPTLDDAKVEEGTTLLDALSDTTTQANIVLAVERLKEAWTGFNFSESTFRNNLRFATELATTAHWYVDQVSSVNSLGASSDITETHSAAGYLAVEEALYDLFSDDLDIDVDATQSVDAPEIETSLSGLQTLKYNHAKVVAWMSLQTLGANPNATRHKQALGMTDLSGTATPGDAWFSKTLADVAFTPEQLTEILNTVASHGSRISDDGKSHFAFAPNDTITVVVNVTDGRSAKTTADPAASTNIHRWKIQLRQKTAGESNPKSNPLLATSYIAFGHTLSPSIVDATTLV